MFSQNHPRSIKYLAALASVAALLPACSKFNGGFENVKYSIEGENALGLKQSKYDVNLHPMNKLVCDPFGGGGSGAPERGVKASLYYMGAGSPILNSTKDFLAKGTMSPQNLFFTDINVPTRMFSEGFSTPTGDVVKNDEGEKLFENFMLKFETSLMLSEGMDEGDYELASIADDGVLIKAKIDGKWVEVLNHDSEHPTAMACSSRLYNFKRDTVLPIEVHYYQGPRFHIANMLIWKKSDAAIAGKDAECNQFGNHYFFDPDKGSKPLDPYKRLLARNWVPVPESSYFIPMSDFYNPCVAGTNPVISDFGIAEMGSESFIANWKTDISATSQVLVTDMSTGAQLLTTTDNALRTSHSIRITGLLPNRQYKIQAVSISENLGKAASDAIVITTLE